MLIFLNPFYLITDPYCVVSFGQYSQKTLVKEQTLTPVWNETCLFDNVEIFGNKNVLKESPPLVVIELYDEDSIVSKTRENRHIDK